MKRKVGIGALVLFGLIAMPKAAYAEDNEAIERILDYLIKTKEQERILKQEQEKAAQEAAAEKKRDQIDREILKRARLKTPRRR